MDLVASKKGKDKLRFALWCVTHSLEWCQEASASGLPRHAVAKRMKSQGGMVFNARFRYHNVQESYRKAGDPRAARIGCAKKVQCKGRTKAEVGKDLQACAKGVSRFSAPHALILLSRGCAATLAKHNI